MIVTSLSSSRFSTSQLSASGRSASGHFVSGHFWRAALLRTALLRTALLGIGALLAFGMVSALGMASETTNLSLATISFGVLPESTLSHLNELLSGDLLLGLQATVLLLTLSHLVGEIPSSSSSYHLSKGHLSKGSNFPNLLGEDPLTLDFYRDSDAGREQLNGGRMSYQTMNSNDNSHTPSGFSARSPFFVIPKRSLSHQRPGEKLPQHSWMARLTRRFSERCVFGYRTSSTETLSVSAC